MKKSLLILSTLLFAFIMSAQFLEVNAFSTVTFDVESYFDEYNTTINTITDEDYGSVLSFDTQLGSSSGYTFKYWVINGVVEMNSDVDDVFPVVEDMTVKALFSPSDSHLVVYMDSNGLYLDLEYVSNGGTALDAGTYDVPSKPGYDVAAVKWDKALTNITDDTVMILQYEKVSSDSYSITVNNGTGDGAYEYNTYATVVADAPTGEDVFSHWEDADGNVVSLSSTYTFTVLYDRTLTAVYDTSAPSDTPVVGTQLLELRDGYRTYLSQAYVPDGYTVIEYGIVTSVEEQTPSLNYDNADNVYRASLMNSTTGEFLASIPKDHFYARSYLVTKDGAEVISVTYGPEIVHPSGHNPMVLDFEDESKSSYAGATVAINGNDWYIDVALIGNTSSDLKYDTKSLRIDDQGSITSEFAFESGIDSIHLLYGLYGSDASTAIGIQYAYEWDPTTWIDVEITAENYEITVDNTELAAITVDVNIDASIYIKIVKLSGTARMNIDNIIIDSATYSDPNDPVILGAGDATISEGDTFSPLDGVTALDFYDGDISGDIEVTTYDSEMTEVTSPGDYSGLSAGTYTIQYDVADSDLSTSTTSITLTIQAESSYTNVGTELFISEYIEGSSSNKAIEIYNPTGETITLTGVYTLRIASNGGSWGSAIALNGSILPGDVFVIANGSANATILAAADQTSGSISFNGDDAVGLFKDGVLIDIIGVQGVDPGTEWSIGTYGTADGTIIRNSDVTGPVTTWDTGEWTSYTTDYADDLGSHTCTYPS